MQISIGQALGIKTAGDRLRAAERAALRRGRMREREKIDERDSKRVEYLRSKNIPDDVIAAMLAIK